MNKRRRFVILVSVGSIVGLALLVGHLSRPAPLYKVTVFTTPGEVIDPRSLNDLGQVVGFITGEGESDWYLFLWDRVGGMRDLGPVSQRECAINNAGQIALTLLDSHGNEEACLRDPNGAMQRLGTLGGPVSVATALNDRGQVVGWSTTLPDANGVTPTHAFIWDKESGMRDLGSLGKTHSVPKAVDDAGQVFGHYGGAPDVEAYGAECYWNTTDPVAVAAAGLPLPDGGYDDMNRQGYVVGRYQFLDEESRYVVLWREYEGLKKLFPYEPGGGTCQGEGALLINDANQVIWSELHQSRWGRYIPRVFPMRERRFFWDPQRGKMALERCVPRGLEVLSIEDLNNKGCILGLGYGKDSTVGILLEPIPERWAR
jgi:probable HAF family extracellular repeat protein